MFNLLKTHHWIWANAHSTHKYNQKQVIVVKAELPGCPSEYSTGKQKCVKYAAGKSFALLTRHV